VTGAEVRRRIVRAPVALGVAVGAALLALAGHAVVLAIWPDAHTLLIDLEVYRAGGRFLLDGRPLYERGVVLDLLPFVYPPVAAVLFAPLALVAMPVLKVLWTALGLALLACTARRCARAVGVAAGAPTVAVVVLVTALATWLDPVRTTLYLGQINIVLLALVLGDLLGRRDSRWRGVGLGLAAAVKLTPLLFVAYLLLRRRYRAAATAVATFVAAGAVGFLLAPADSATYWLRGTFAAADRIAAVDGNANHSVNGLVTRLLGPGRWRRPSTSPAPPSSSRATLALAVRVAGRGRGTARGEPVRALRGRRGAVRVVAPLGVGGAAAGGPGGAAGVGRARRGARDHAGGDHGAAGAGGGADPEHGGDLVLPGRLPGAVRGGARGGGGGERVARGSGWARHPRRPGGHEPPQRG
jgi:hypothetical protein